MSSQRESSGLLIPSKILILNPHGGVIGVTYLPCLCYTLLCYDKKVIGALVHFVSSSSTCHSWPLSSEGPTQGTILLLVATISFLWSAIFHRRSIASTHLVLMHAQPSAFALNVLCSLSSQHLCLSCDLH